MKVKVAIIESVGGIHSTVGSKEFDGIPTARKFVIDFNSNNNYHKMFVEQVDGEHLEYTYAVIEESKVEIPDNPKELICLWCRQKVENPQDHIHVEEI